MKSKEEIEERIKKLEPIANRWSGQGPGSSAFLGQAVARAQIRALRWVLGLETEWDKIDFS
jgi:hypothetical protein